MYRVFIVLAVVAGFCGWWFPNSGTDVIADVFWLFTPHTEHAYDDHILSLLRSNRIDRLEDMLGGYQARFEKGEMTENELHNAYHPFQALDAASVANLEAWVANAPKSYVAHVALAVYLKELGLAWRGNNYVSTVPAENLQSAEGYFTLAQRAFEQSLPLTAKPYLSLYHLVIIARYLDDRASGERFLAAANAAYPANALVRDQFLIGLLPRWGGSYPAAQAFIARSADDGVPDSVLAQLRAIVEDDIGHSLMEGHLGAAAMPHFVQALKLAHDAPGFVASFLLASYSYACQPANGAAYCRWN